VDDARLYGSPEKDDVGVDRPGTAVALVDGEVVGPLAGLDGQLSDVVCDLVDAQGSVVATADDDGCAALDGERLSAQYILRHIT